MGVRLALRRDISEAGEGRPWRRARVVRYTFGGRQEVVEKTISFNKWLPQNDSVHYLVLPKRIRSLIAASENAIVHYLEWVKTQSFNNARTHSAVDTGSFIISMLDLRAHRCAFAMYRGHPMCL